MRILIDECIDPRVATLFSGHFVKTVHQMGWDRLQDGPLLKLAEKSFEVFITIDRSLEHQQNLKSLKVGVVVVGVSKNQVSCYRACGQQLLAAVASVQPGKVIHVEQLRSG